MEMDASNLVRHHVHIGKVLIYIVVFGPLVGFFSKFLNFIAYRLNIALRPHMH